MFVNATRTASAATLPIALITALASAQGALYRVVDLGVAPGSSESRAVDINASGHVLVDASWPPQSYVYDPDVGQLVSLGAPPGSSRFVGSKINASGQVVGSGSNSIFLYTPGQGFTDLGGFSPGQPSQGVACGLNDFGEVVGSARGLAPSAEPFFWTESAGMLSVTQGISGYLCDLNNSREAIGQIGNQYGYWVQSSGAIGLFVPLAFEPDSLHDDGTVAGHSLAQNQLILRDRFGQVTQIPTPTGQYTGWTVSDLNRARTLVGNWQYYRVNGSSVIFNTGTFIYLPTLGLVDLSPSNNGVVDSAWDIESLAAINELGQIVGSGHLRSSVDAHAIRLDPVSPAAEVATVGQGCRGPGTQPPQLGSDRPVIARAVTFVLSGASAARPGFLAIGTAAPAPIPLLGCSLYLDPTAPIGSLPLSTNAGGGWSGGLDLPPEPLLLGLTFSTQALVIGGAQGVEFSNALDLTIGF